MENISFVTDYPAVFIRDEGILAIADVQIGFEQEIFKKGVTIQPQIDKFVKTVNRLLDMTGAKKLVVVGDIKHKVPGITLREERHVARFFSEFEKKVKLILVKGNHDTDLEKVVPDHVDVYDSKGVRIGNYGFFHGHGWPDKDLTQCDWLFMGHLQPGVEFRDSMGYRNVHQVWVRGNLDKAVVKKHYGVSKTGEMNYVIIPAFNPLLGSGILNSDNGKDYSISFMAGKSMRLKDADVYLLDGSSLGKVRSLKKVKRIQRLG
jgi:putative SbcD/Mre11-related phosphoesterase